MGMLRTTLASLLLLASTATAQIDVTDYLPLGAFNAWQTENVNDVDDVSNVRVTKVRLIGGVLRYTLSIPVLDGLESIILVLGVDEGVLNMYAMRVSTNSVEEISAEKIRFDPPIVLGTTTTVLDAAPVSTDVDTVQKIKISLGPFDKSIDLFITGTVSSSWLSILGDIITPLGQIPAADLVGFVIGFDLTITSDDGLIDVDETFTESMGAVLALDRGYLQISENGENQFLLRKAILPGQTLGDFPPLPASSFVGLTAPVPDLFTVHETSDALTTGGDFVLTDVRLEHRLRGKLLLHANAALVGSLEAPVPVLLKGSCKLRKDGSARLKLSGRIKLADVDKKVRFKARQDVVAGSTSISITYKSGKDYEGAMQLGIAPVADVGVTLTLATPVDRKLIPKAKRQLGAEGVLSIGGVEFPVTTWGTVRVKEGKPDRHLYSVRPTGLNGNVIRMRGEGTDPGDFAMNKLTLKIFGRKVVFPDFVGVTSTIE